jgi:hypothetical protein
MTRHRFVVILALGVIVAGYAILLLGLHGAGIWLLDREGLPARSDFLAIWTAGRLALGGMAADAYDWVALEAEMRRVGVPTPEGLPPLGWMYPPGFLLVAAILAMAPWTWSFLAWQGMTIALLCATQATITRDQRGLAILLGVATPCALLCAVQGQTGFLTAALLGSALFWLDRKPALAGALLGLATFKPHIGFVIPLLLVATGRWKVLLFGGLAACAFGAAAALILGIPAWVAFLGSLHGSSSRFLMADGFRVPLQSIHSTMLDIGADRSVAGLAHGGVALAALLGALTIWRDPGSDEGLRGASALGAAYLATPYALPHDSVALAVAAGFLLRHAGWDVLSPTERSLLLLAVIVAPAGSLLSRASFPMPAAWLTMLGLTFWLYLRLRQRPGAWPSRP